MFPLRKLARLITTISALCLVTVLVITTLLSLLASVTDLLYPGTSTAVFYQAVLSCSTTSAEHFVDDHRSLKSRFSKEIEFRERLTNLSTEQISELSHQYYRDLNIHLHRGGRRLLPPSKPLYDMKCLSYLDTDYEVEVSVVLAYHNELSVLLLRTLTTIMHRTPLRYLKEIILIDDKSSFNITEEVSEYAREQRMPIKYLTNSERQGIANSRMRGIQEAEGDVVVILDTHMEVNDFWLEPLLSILDNKPDGIAVPLLHMIHETEYDRQGVKLAQPFIVQPRKGHGHLALINYRRVQDSTTRSRWEPLPSPGVMGGGLAAHRSTLLEYYPVSVVNSSWGVENNRLSFRAWMCGEGVWVSPCSQVLHPNGNDVALGRYFEGRGHLFSIVIHESVAEALNFIEEEVDKEKLIFKVANSLKDHVKIKTISEIIRNSFNPQQQQQCKSYRWYLNNVFASYISWERDQFDHVGEVRSLHDPNTCLEVLDRKLELYSCRRHQLVVLDTHTTGFTKNQDVRNGNIDEECWDTGSYDEGGEIKMYECHVRPADEGSPYDSQKFIYNETSQQIAHLPSGRCLEFVYGPGRARPLLMKCSSDKIQQKWDILASTWF